jgi:hypothetical protein
MASRATALAAQQAGQGGDPVHAALMGIIGEQIAKGTAKGINKLAGDDTATPPGAPPPPGGSSPQWTANIHGMSDPSSPYMTAISNIPQAAMNVAGAIPKAVKAIPEVAAQTIATGAETIGKGAASMKIKGADTLGEMIGDFLRFKSMSPEKYAFKKVLGDIKKSDLPKIQESSDAAKRLELEYWTPAEAKNSLRESAKQGGIGRTDEGIDKLQERSEARIASEYKAVDNLLNKIYDPNKLANLKNEKYKSAMQSVLPFEFIGRHRNRATVVKAIDEIKNNPALRQLIEEEVGAPLESINPNSFQYWDLIKQAMDELEENNKSKTGKSTTSSNVYGNTRREIVKQMDEINPDYKPARRIAERGFVRKKLESYFDSRKKNVLNMAKFLEKSSNKDYLMRKLNDLPDAIQKIKDFETAGKSIIPVNKTTRASRSLAEMSMSDARNTLEAKKRALQQKYGEAHDVAAVNLMTDPAWIEKLKSHLKDKGRK